MVRRSAVNDRFVRRVGHIRRSLYVARFLLCWSFQRYARLILLSRLPLVYRSRELINYLSLLEIYPYLFFFKKKGESFRMFTFSNFTTTKARPRSSLHFQTFTGWTSTIQRMRSFGTSSVKPRRATLRRANSSPPIQTAYRAKGTQPISLPLPLDYTVPVCGAAPKDSSGFESFCCTKVVLVASTDPSPHCRIRRINTRKELPWIPISKPLPALPPSPDVPDSNLKIQSVVDAPHVSTSYPVAPRNSKFIFDDGLDDLSLFLRRIAYETISASIIHRHLGFMEDGGRVLSFGSISRPKRFSSLIGVSLAIMEGRLPKALMVMY